MKEYEPTIEQRDIIKTNKRTVCVLAIPGSGKSTTIENRIKYLIQKKEIAQNEIVMVTFSNRAATIIREHMKEVFGDKLKCFIGTFHSLCLWLLRTKIKEFYILTELQQQEMLKKIYAECFDEPSTKQENLQKVIEKIQQKKQESECDYTRFVFDYDNKYKAELQNKILSATEKEEQIFYLYLQAQCQSKQADFEDLIEMVLYLMQSDKDFCEKQQRQHRYIMCDEYQDVNEKQDNLLRLLCGESGNLMVVGDDDQNIYGWRGTDFQCINNFWNYAEQKLTLSCNFRCTSEILEIGDSVVSKNKKRIHKEMRTATKEKGDKPRLITFETNQDEAEWIANEIIDSSRENIAILVRKKTQFAVLEESLRRHEIEYEKNNTEIGYMRRELALFLSYLKMINDEQIADEDFELTVNYPRRGYGEKAVEKLKKQRQPGEHLFNTLYREIVGEQKEEVKRKNCQLLEYCETIRALNEEYHQGKANSLDVIDGLSKIFFKERKEQISEEDLMKSKSLGSVEFAIKKVLKAKLVEHLAELDDVICNYKEYVEPEKRGRVNLLTIHASKGDEFDTVFIPGMIEGVFPGYVTTDKQYEEERRTFYVAITRAKKRLIISNYRSNAGRNGLRPSSLLADIKPELLKCERNYEKM